MAARTLLAAALLGTAVFAVPIEERQACASQWGQCGGQGWTGPSCCAAGSVCTVSNPFYSQCLPGSAAPSSSSTVASSTSTVRTSSTPVVSPSRTSTVTGSVSTTSAGTGTTPPPTGGATYTGNPFVGVNLWANSYYASEISTLAIPSLSPALATAAAKVAKVPTFMWMDTRSKIPLVDATLADIRKANQAGANYAGEFVVYNLPDRDCAAAASNGELSIADGGVAKYKQYIDDIRAMVVKYSDIRIILTIEPDSLANLVTNLNVPKCAGAQAAYLEGTNYAVTQLNLPNVAMYLDGGHAGWLGWPANLPPAAAMYAKVYKDAGKPKALRGLVTNVSNYNGYSISTAPSYTQGNANYDEKHYIEALAPLLSAEGWDAKFIVDQGRSGKQPTGQLAWGDWCNAIGTGFGVRPTANTGSTLVDAFVWVKPGGESDGTSDTTAARYDLNCGKADALKPAPEAGTWFQAYFEQLLINANPAF
ncbi:glycosyl hydrolase family 6 [Colletotrichum graminicola]|uniref:Glucanase n=1 Tax=Colletotrichum graminicola (strain M1.001 / M2 / FGSC 10212) TaxID=645133 RepID=E3Q540_COLGM|nr:glycosyl hydrolase family 6 [Colletotrichum graminicola M1.001]EFQ25807.1 glycosyl hydrolase family 6 [Colletotrichum graminicola M1.001]WDK22915.1 glycosyl hydrolase family 6 [Colletotrichum graminicola]